MANLDFWDKHNMVAYLQNSEGSKEQFWQTASASTLKNGDMEITATIDGKVKVVSEASIRRHIKLEDSDGISTLPTTEIFEQLALMGAPSTSQPPTSPPSMQTTHVAEEAANMPHDSPLLEDHTPRIKKLEHKVKSRKSRRRAKIMISDDEDYQEDPSKQGRQEYDLEPDFEFTAPEEDYTAEPDISTANVPISTVGPKVSTVSPEVRTAAESLKKTKLQLEQERLRLEEALRLQEQLDEEERQRIAKVQEKARTFNTKEWDNIQAQIEILSMKERENLPNKELNKKEQAMISLKKGLTCIKTISRIWVLYSERHTLQQLKKLSFDIIKELFEITMKRVNTFTPMESDDTVSKVVVGSSKRDVEQELNMKVHEQR
ncbi:hypothetical protein Tco_1354261 [Tanacetum coccineum]